MVVTAVAPARSVFTAAEFSRQGPTCLTSHLSTSPSQCQSPSPPQVPPTPRTSRLFNKTNIRKVPTVFVNRKPCGGGGFPNPSWTTPDVRPEIINTQNNFPPYVIIVVSHNLKSSNVEINNSALSVL